ncbi:MAG: hypothetical protein HKP21_04135, partial [Xanthomonadales bacterium]|nr:hypothetical protein [Gammaproteobacteria bacterium]NNK03720.1 hypothetical protein [Xanthomonadales bacterium]
MNAKRRSSPKQEYKRESFEMFSDLPDNIQHEVVRILARVQVVRVMPKLQPSLSCATGARWAVMRPAP